MPVKFEESEVSSLGEVSQEPGCEACFEDLVHALRNPGVVFGEAAPSELVATCALADWESSVASLRRVLEQSGQSAADALRSLRLAGEFARQHHIRLDGAPWLCVFELDDDLWARYDIHTNLSVQAAAIWDGRFDDTLRTNKLDRESFYLRFMDAGPL